MYVGRIPYHGQHSQKWYDDYYMQQVGSGLPVFAGVPRQRGHGIGNVLSGLIRVATPLLKKGAVALGKQAAKTGMQIAEDVLRGENIKEAVKTRAKQAGMSMVRKALSQVAPPGETAGRGRSIKRNATGRRVSSRPRKKRRKALTRDDIFTS